MTADLWHTPTIVPTLGYHDVARAVDWLTRVFGFRERPGSRLEWEGGSMAWLELDDALIHVTAAGGHGVQSPRETTGISQQLKVYVDDVDAHFRRASAGGAVIVSEPEDGFWGGRVYRAQDVEGHQWEFSQRGRDLAAHLWKLPPGLTRRHQA